MIEKNVDIGGRLKKLRQDMHLTKETVAEYLDVSLDHYRRIENGQYTLSADKYVLLRKYMDIDPLYLLTGESRLDKPYMMGIDLSADKMRVMEGLFEYCNAQSVTKPKRKRRNPKNE